MDHRHVAPGQDHGNQKFSTVAIHQAWKTNADTCKLNEVAVLHPQLCDLLANFGEKNARIVCRFEAESGDKAIIKVAQRQNCFFSAYIDTEQTKAQTIEAQRRGWLSTNGSRPSRTLFDDAPISQKFTRNS